MRAFDPAAAENARRFLTGVEHATDAYDCARGADALVLATEWNEFRALDFSVLARLMKSKVFIDLRNVYDPAEMKSLGWIYSSVGRG